MKKYNTLDQADLAGKRVLLRAGFDVPIVDGVVGDKRRIESIVPTMRYILDHGASLIIMAHQGRPSGERVPEMSQQPLVPVLEELLGVSVQFADDCRGEATQSLAASLEPGQVLLLENLRFDAAEKSKDESERDALGRDLAALADVYVDDAFTNAHRDHASMTSVPKFIPGYVGLQLQKEIEYLEGILTNAEHPLLLIISGAKMETKVPVVKKFLDKGNDILLGGCIANTFIAAEGFDVGESRYEESYRDSAQSILLAGEKEDCATIHIPTDAILASDPDAQASVDLPLEDIEGDMKIFDIGSKSIQHYCDIVSEAKTIIWNGPMGMYESELFAGATKRIAQAVSDATQRGALTIIGGGDTLDFHDRYPEYSVENYSFASTGGGSMLDLISGKKLPALEALRQ